MPRTVSLCVFFFCGWATWRMGGGVGSGAIPAGLLNQPTSPGSILDPGPKVLDPGSGIQDPVPNVGSWAPLLFLWLDVDHT